MYFRCYTVQIKSKNIVIPLFNLIITNEFVKKKMLLLKTSYNDNYT